MSDVTTIPEPMPAFGVCGCGEQFGDGTPALKLATNRPLVLVRDALPGFTQDQIWAWFDEAYNRRWAKVCDWYARRIRDLTEAGPSDYVNLITVDDLGGGGILADQMLPYSGGRILRMRLNSRIQWRPHNGPGQGIDPVRVIAHEGGHFMGHAHWPAGAPPELMEPTYSPNVQEPQPTEGKVSAGWFGPPVTQPPPPPPPTPGKILLEVEVLGEITDIRAPGFRVIKMAG